MSVEQEKTILLLSTFGQLYRPKNRVRFVRFMRHALAVLMMTIMSVVAATTLCAAQTAKQPETKPKLEPITGFNFKWTTYQNGWADLSFSLRNNTRNDVKNVNFRVVFYNAGGEPIHFEEDSASDTIPPGLAVQKTIRIYEGGLNLYHSAARMRVVVLSIDDLKAKQ
jgi:hypothetical protein